jgi:hypothetical protein
LHRGIAREGQYISRNIDITSWVVSPFPILDTDELYLTYNANQGLKEECEGAKRGSGSVKFARKIQINSSKVVLSDL